MSGNRPAKSSAGTYLSYAWAPLSDPYQCSVCYILIKNILPFKSILEIL